MNRDLELGARTSRLEDVGCIDLRSNPIVVGPTERHVERAPRGKRVVSERRFFERLRSALNPSERPATGALARALAREAVLELLHADGSITRSAAERVGIGRAADTTLGSLRACTATVEDLHATRTQRGRLLADLMRAFDERLIRAGYVDRRASLRATASDLAAGRVELPSAISLEGMVELDAAKVDAWNVLHRAIRLRGGEGVTLRWPREEISATAGDVADWLERRLAAEEEPFEIEWFETGTDKLGERAIVLEAHGDEAEARVVVAEVAAALASGIKPDRVWIVLPHRDEALLEPLRVAFDDAGIAMSEAWGSPVEASPEARGVLSILEMLVGRLDRDALVEILCTPGIHPGSLVRESDETRAVDRASKLASRLRELPVVQDRDGRLLVEVLRAAANERSDDFWMVGSMEKLAEQLLALRDRPTPERFVGGLSELITRLRLGEPSAREISVALQGRIGGSAAMRAIGEGVVAVRAIRDALSQLRDAHRVMGSAEAPLDLAELSLELRATLDSLRTSARGAAGRAAAVRVGDASEGLGLEHDLVVITRMAGRGYVPGPQSTLLDEETRRALPASRRPKTHRERAATREAQLAWAASSGKRIALSFMATDRDGRETEPPHPLVLRARDAAARTNVEPPSRVSPRASRLSERDSALMWLAAGSPTPSDLVARVSIELERAAFFADPRATPGPFTGWIAPREQARLVQAMGGATPARAVNVTLLERATVCAFRAFADRALQSRRIEEAQDVLGPRERGELLHRALHEAFEQDRERAPSATVETRVANARSVIERVLEVGGVASALRREGRLRAARDALMVFADDIGRDSALQYREGEREFAEGRPFPWGALELEGSTPDSRVFVRGRIDRIDATTDGRELCIIDYKTGKPRSQRRRDATDFQVPLYALCAKRMEGVERISGVYVAIGPGGSSAWVPTKPSDRELPDDLLEETSRNAARAMERVWSGVVSPRPATLGACKRCDARDLCRRPAVMPEAADEDAS